MWDRGDSTRSIHPAGQTFLSAWNDMSRDGEELPVLAWGDLGYGYTYGDVGCVAFPNATGWDVGEEIPGSDGLFLTPKVTRDRNGDAWLIWDLRGEYVTRFTHSYISATTGSPEVVGVGASRMITWTLSEPAPGSWWAVLRAREDEPYEEVARVRAGDDPAMSWTDFDPQATPLRYRIRRESVTRYQWLSEEALVAVPPQPGPGGRLRLVRISGNPTEASVRYEVLNAAAGPLDIRVYDLRGRLLMRQRFTAGGSGRDTIQIDFSAAATSPTPGLYFLQVADSSGAVSQSTKIALIQ